MNSGGDREVTTEEAEKRAAEFNIMFIETSAKAGHNVKPLFKKIAQSLPGMDKDGQQGEQEGQNKSECRCCDSYQEDVSDPACAHDSTTLRRSPVPVIDVSATTQNPPAEEGGCKC